MWKAVGVNVLIFAVISLGANIGNFFYDLALNPNSDKGIVVQASHNQISVEEDEKETLNEFTEGLEEWYNAVTHQDHYIQSFDNLRLHSISIANEAPSKKWVITCHGYTGEGIHSIGAARKFYNMGFNVLMPDARGHGTSEGDYIGMGWDDRLDIVAWINELMGTYGEDIEIVLYGVSMGGATVMMTAGEDLPSNVKAIVEDCGYSSIKGEFEYQLKALFGIPSFPVLNWANKVTYAKAGYNFAEGNSVSQVAKSKTPILFIHGSEDTFVPFYMLDEVYQAATCEKDILVVEGAGHGLASMVAPELYWNTVEQFIDKYLK